VEFAFLNPNQRVLASGVCASSFDPCLPDQLLALKQQVAG
jgi:hypothetical protein